MEAPEHNMTDGEFFVWLTLAVLGVVVAALASGSEIACYSLNRVRLDLRAGRTGPGSRADLLRKELDRPDRLLANLVIWLAIATEIGAIATTRLLETKFHSPIVIALVNVAVLTPILLIFGEALPKDLFRVEADRIAYVLARPLALSRHLLTWCGLLPLVLALTKGVEKLLRLPPQGRSDARQRIALLLKEGAGSGVLSESQVTLVDRALMLRGLTVADEMLPWKEVKVLPLDTDRARILKIIGGSQHAFIPVVGEIQGTGNREQGTGKGAEGVPAARPAGYGVVGVIEQIDLYLRPTTSLIELIRPAVRLKKSVRIREALLVLREHKARLGIVEDNAGRPIGIVTPKDLVEPLTGELADL